MAYLNPKFAPEDKTTEKEKAQQDFRAQLIGIRKVPGNMDKSSYRRRADYLADTGRSATAFEVARRTKREQEALEAKRQAMLRETARIISTSVGQGRGPDLTPNISYRGGGGGYSGSSGNTSFDKFMAAISAQESGGNYGARNRSSGAMGKYQIMPSNLAGSGRGWDYEALGRDVSPSEFLNSPQIQEQIARYKMQQYYNKWGPRGAAIAWYAGPGAVSGYSSQSLNAPQGQYPSISGYAQAILRRLGL